MKKKCLRLSGHGQKKSYRQFFRKRNLERKAFEYAFKRREFLGNHFKDCAISNNAAENAIRPFTVGRKNWLFSDTLTKGAKASADIYSIVETAKAKANGLDVFKYFERNRQPDQRAKK